MTTRLLTGSRRILWGLAGQLLVALPASGAAGTEKAAAEALFQQGTELMANKEFAAACAKFEASSAIESGLGVKLWLADCYDHAGRSASAWALFTEAAALAHQSGQADREQAATERAADLEQRLSKLELKAPPQGLPKGTSVMLNGVSIPVGSVGTALPVDPGPQNVVLRAPGYRTLTLKGDAPAGPSHVTLDVPPLALEPASAPKPVPAAAASEAKPGSTQRTIGYTVGGLGLLSFAGAGFFAYRAHSLDNDSHQHCLVNEPNACDAKGASLRDQARTNGNVATGVFAGGTALTLTGLVLLLTAPSAKSENHVQVGASATPHGASFFVKGSL